MLLLVLGVSWVDMHLLAERVLLEKLKEGGLLQGDINSMMKVHLAKTFFPNSVGHLLGIDIMDPGAFQSV